MGCLSENYTLLRDTSLYDRVYYSFHRLGIQSNVIVSAEYSSHESTLSDDAVYAALATVIKAHPALCAVGVRLPSSSPKKHTLHLALLHKIDFRTCVVFIDGDEATRVDSKLLENAHNMWDWTDDEPDGPWWKVLVVGRKHVVFVYHHFVGDGISGAIFHREFLAALNALPSDLKSIPSEFLLTDTSTVQYPPEPTEHSNITPSIPRLLWRGFIWWLLRLFFSRKLLFSDLPPPRPYIQSAVAKAAHADRIVTRVASYRIPSPKMRAVLSACRANQTTFTPLLITLLNLTLASDFYPRATFGATRISVNLRPYLPAAQPGDVTWANIFTNAGSGMDQIHYLEPFRKAVATYNARQGVADLALFRRAVWRMVREYKAMMENGVNGSVRDWMGCTLVGNSIEDFINRSLPSIGHLSSETFLVSNLGAFSSHRKGASTKDGVEASWTIEDMQFSAGATNGNVGCRGVIFNVAGVAGGDTVINASFEDGIMHREMVEGILNKAMEKLDWLLD